MGRSLSPSEISSLLVNLELDYNENSDEAEIEEIDIASSSSSDSDIIVLGEYSHNTLSKVRNGGSRHETGYSFSCMATEDHGMAIYGCQFNHHLADGQPLILATVGGNKVSIYECTDATADEPERLKIIQSHTDCDKDESFYTCAWSLNEYDHSILAVGGEKGLIRIFSPSVGKCIKTIIAHRNIINHLLFHPDDTNLLFSASKDYSIRLWNVETEAGVAIFAGVRGHRDQVLFIDIDESGSRLISGGMDHTIKMWSLKTPEIDNVIQKSYQYMKKFAKTNPFPTLNEHFPVYSTTEIHNSYVDCLMWFSTGVISKSCDNTVKCWKFGLHHEELDKASAKSGYETFASIIHDFPINYTDHLWFIKFDMNLKKTCFALGNASGQICLYDLTVDDPTKISFTVLGHPLCTSTIRQTAFSKDGSVLVAVCDDSTVWRWGISKSVE